MARRRSAANGGGGRSALSRLMGVRSATLRLLPLCRGQTTGLLGTSETVAALSASSATVVEVRLSANGANGANGAIGVAVPCGNAAMEAADLLGSGAAGGKMGDGAAGGANVRRGRGLRRAWGR